VRATTHSRAAPEPTHSRTRSLTLVAHERDAAKAAGPERRQCLNL
jgi:hypothetical protein